MQKVFDRAYERLSPRLQDLACSIEGLRLENDRYKTDYGSIWEVVLRRSRLGPQELAEFRDFRLRQFLKGAAGCARYYRDTSSFIWERMLSVEGLGTLDTLPLLTKQVVQDNLAGFSVCEYAARKGSVLNVHTSGTTGSGLRFRATKLGIQEQWAIWWRYRQWHGIHRGEWCGYFGGRSIVPIRETATPFWRVNSFGRQVFFSAYHLSGGNARHYVGEIVKRKLRWLHGYPSLLTVLASFVLDQGLDVGTHIRWITTGAENLLPFQRTLIERAFGVTPRQHYGMAEAVANISECELGGLHVDEDFAAVEFLPVEGQAFCRIVGTNLSNPAFPLVRYFSGDLAVLRPEGCPCGKPGRVVLSIDGRQEDYVVLPSGAVIGRLDHIFKDMVAVREAQVYQPNRGRIVFRVVRGPNYTDADERYMISSARQRLGDEVELKIDYLNSIERTSSGKLRFVVSDVKDLIPYFDR